MLFDGSAPSTGSEVFNDADNVTVYRMPSAVGWGATLDGRPVLLWPPLPPAPHAATATGSVINGFVVAASITDEGWGYTNTPPVRIIGGGGSGAQAVALTWVSGSRVVRGCLPCSRTRFSNGRCYSSKTAHGETRPSGYGGA